MSRPILVAATKRQFERFLAEQNKTGTDMSGLDLNVQMRSFLANLYPGLDYSPYKMVEIMASKNVEESAVTNSLFNTFDADCESLDFCVGEPLMSKL